MLRAQLKILAAILALGVLGGTVVGALYFWEKIFKPDAATSKELNAVLAAKAGKADPGRAVYAQGMELIRHNDLEAAREKLRMVTRIYPDSEFFDDSRRVLGEMNLDRLFSRAPMPGKLEYTVGPREPGLDPIAKKNRTTIPFIRRINNLSGTVIHPGDHLILFPLDFEIEVRVSRQTLTLLQKGEFFKDYSIVEFNLGTSKLPSATYIGTKPAFIAGKAVRDFDPHYTSARKWLQTVSKPGRPGVIFCAAPKKKDDGTPNGIYLDEADIEELSTIVRLNTPVKFIQR
ncbi:MAG: LysM peptidoglycan-binding domain-containing protein [Verrucomicrobiales bacterium]|nr:LysM peptidoglycan-binding domain-containing protein [Verrucomicrobiales bacterium]